MASTLTKEIITFWRDASSDPAFDAGIKFLLDNYAPKPNRLDKIETQLNDTLNGSGYRKAMDDLKDILTQYPSEPEDINPPQLQRI